MPFSVNLSKEQDIFGTPSAISGTPASRPLFVPPGFPRTGRAQRSDDYHSPRNFYKLIPLPFFFFVIFFVIFTGIRCGHRFFCNSHALLGESRGLENIFCKFYEINSSQEFFLYCKHFGVDGILKFISAPLPTIQSETWLVHAKVREPHLNPPVRVNFCGFTL